MNKTTHIHIHTYRLPKGFAVWKHSNRTLNTKDAPGDGRKIKQNDQNLSCRRVEDDEGVRSGIAEVAKGTARETDLSEGGRDRVTNKRE